MMRLGKREIAELLGGAYVMPNTGTINYRKLESYLCSVLNISREEYRRSHLFTESQVKKFLERKILSLK